MDGAAVEPVAYVPLKLEAVENPSSSLTFEEPLLGLGHPPVSCCRGIYSQVSQHIVMLRTLVSQIELKSLGSFFAARDEACLVCVDFEAGFREELVERSVSHHCFPCYEVWVGSYHIKGDIIDPGLQCHSRM